MNPALSSFLSRHLVDRAGGHRRAALERFAEKVRADRADPEARERRTATALAALLEHARARVPFYREAMGGVAPVEPETAREVLATLPVISRAGLQAMPEAFRAEGDGAVVEDATGGSSGTPMTFFVDRETQLRRESSLMWANALAGWSHGERIAMLWGADRDVRSTAAQRRSALRWWIENCRWYNAFDMGPARMDSFHRELARFRPHFLVAYAGSLGVYAAYLKERGVRPGYPATALISSAEVLTPYVRGVAKEVFERPVFDRYGSREFGALAAECPVFGGLHVNAADAILEIDDADVPGEPGRLLVTYLHNRAMPFVRYDTGDLAAWAPEGACPCGRTTPRLERIAGRMSDTITTSEGRAVHGEFFTHLLYGCDGVRTFQFVQEAVDDYVLRVQGEPGLVERHGGAWQSAIQPALGASATLRIEQVAVIPPLPSGKRKYTVGLDERAGTAI